MTPIYPGASAVGSNKIVVNPVSGGANQRRARAWPSARTRPSASSSARARCTVRWLAPPLTGFTTILLLPAALPSG